MDGFKADAEISEALEGGDLSPNRLPHQAARGCAKSCANEAASGCHARSTLVSLFVLFGAALRPQADALIGVGWPGGERNL